MLMPYIYNADNFLKSDARNNTRPVADGRWLAARPEPYHGWYFLRRLALAWGVFMGRYDVLDWGDP